jgi:hypothetical protein
MNRSTQAAAVALLIVLLGHPLAAVCACWQGTPSEPATGGSCHEGSQPGSNVQSIERDCCQVAPATRVPTERIVQSASAPLLPPPSFLSVAADTMEPSAKPSESPPRSPESPQALFGVFLI